MKNTFWTIKAMRAYGGLFVNALATAYETADSINAAKIEATWPEYLAKYEAIGAEMKATPEFAERVAETKARGDEPDYFAIATSIARKTAGREF